ncbi:MAG: ABC transporter ATP-binding protein [Candidatus Hodarchaeales archaeon]|jgi:peptide/nickel transport system ATP-binding protein
MNSQAIKSNILEISNLKCYYQLKGFDITQGLDAKIMEMLQFRPSFEPKPLEKQAIEDYWSFGREKKAIDGIEYTYELAQLVIKAVDGASLNLRRGESLCIIGETGCGKSTLLNTILRLFANYLALIEGEINYYSPDSSSPINLLSLDNKGINEYRGIKIGYIPQLPKESLNPWLTIGFQSGEILLERLSLRQEAIKERVVEYLGKVALPEPKTNYKKYVDSLSVGQAQRVCISMALIADPEILLADEPLASLDAANQATIIDLIQTLKKDLGGSYMFATHNIGAATRLADAIVVMYGGEVVEYCSVSKFLDEPLHPYSQGLLNALPWYSVGKDGLLEEIPGKIPKPYDWPSGCKFHPRCKHVMDKCKSEKPQRTDTGGSFVECFLYE